MRSTDERRRLGADAADQQPRLDAYPVFSPDGQKIAFTSTRDGNSEIYVMNADGTNQTRLTNNTAFDAWPSFSPDSQKIIFTSLRDGATSRSTR